MSVKFIVFTLALLFFSGTLKETRAQSPIDNHPEIDKPCPSYTLTGIQYFRENKVLLPNAGKYTILDFFSSGCSACVEAFPRTNKLYAAFKGKIDIILVGKEDKYIRKMYEKFRRGQQLELPVVFDSVLADRWVPMGYPHLIWIDNRGIVKAVTTSTELTEENIVAFINNKDFEFLNRSFTAVGERENYSGSEIKSYDSDNTNILSASIISLWDGKSEQKGPDQFFKGQTLFDAKCVILRWLYNLAYFNKMYWPPYDNFYGKAIEQPILEIKNKVPFEYDFAKVKNLYNYYQLVPVNLSDTGRRQKILRDDLERTFGYKANIETRLVPVWKLTASDAARKRLLTKGGKSNIESEVQHADFTATNISIRNLIGLIWENHQQEPPIFDETGINGNIDISMHCIMTDLEAIQKELKKQGLELVKSEKEMGVLVISDP